MLLVLILLLVVFALVGGLFVHPLLFAVPARRAGRHRRGRRGPPV